MSDVPSNLIPTRVTQLPLAPVADENSLMMIVYQGNNYQIRVGDLLDVAGVPITRQVIAGSGLAGGGQLSSNVTLSIAVGGVTGSMLENTGVTPGSYGSASTIPVITVDSHGRVVNATTIPAQLSGYVPTSREVIAGTGLTGGGTLNTNVTLNANLSDSTPLSTNGFGTAGVATSISRADHRHPSVNLQNSNEVDGVLPMNNGGTGRSLVPNSGGIVWSGADGLYIGPAGVYGQVLASGGLNQYIWASVDVDVPRPANTVRAGPVSGPNAIPTFRALVNADIPSTLDGKTITGATITSSTIDDSVIGGGTPAAGNFTAVDTTDLEVTNLKAKDGTAAGSIANTTGVVTLNSAVLTTADINGGTIDNATIGGSVPAVGTFTTANATDVNATTVDVTNIEVSNLKAKDGTAAGSIADTTGIVTLNSSVLTTTDINGGSIDNVTIGGSTPAGGTFTTVSATTGNITTVNATTVDTTDIEVTNLKAKDGIAAGSIADTTGIVTLNSAVLTTADINGGTIDNTAIGGSTPSTGKFTQVDVDNLRLDGNILSSTNTDGNIVLAPDGSGDVQLDADTVRVGDSGATATITSNGAGDLVLNTNSGTNSGSITITQGTNGNITLDPNGTGEVSVPAGLDGPLYIDFNTTQSPLPTDATARVYYNSNDQFQTLTYQMNGSVIQHVGEEQYFRVKCSSAVTKGQVVMFTGTLGASGGLTAAPATGLLPDQANYILGIATETGNTNDWIFVTYFGEVKQINTTGGAEVWSQGQVLYYNPSVTGGLTKTKPTAPNAIAVVAAVVHVGTSNGVLFVRPTYGSVLGGTDGNVQFSSLADTDLIQYYGTGQYWRNVTPSSVTVGSATTATNLAGGAAGSIPYQTGSGVTTFLSQASGVLVGGVTPSYSTAPSLTGTNFSSIPNSALQNSSVTLGTTSVSLGGTSLTLGGLTSVAVTQDPSTALQLATKQYVDGLYTSGIHYHQAVKYEVPDTTGNLNAIYNQPGGPGVGVGATLTNNGTLAAFAPDGPTASIGDRILVYNQSNAYENGVYTVTVVGDGSTAWVLTRSTDTDTYNPTSPNGLGQGDAFFVTSGNTGAGETYECNTVGTITFGTTSISFVQISSSQVYSAGTGLTLTGTQFSLTSPVISSLGGTGLTSYTTGDLLYYSTGTALSKLGIGASTYLLTSSGSAPQWSNPSGVTVGNATNATNAINATNATTSTNIAGGSAGALPYNSGAGTTTFLSLGTNGYVLTAGASAPQYVAQSTLSVGSASTATSATTASNIAGGAANQIAYQTGTGATNFITAPTIANTFLEWSGSAFQWSVNPLGTVTSVALSAPTGFSVSGSPVTTNGTLSLSFSAGYSLPTNASQTNWDTAYSERLQWDGGSTNLVAATGRTSLGGTTVGQNVFTLTNPSAITFPRFNADNTVSALNATDFRTAIGAGTGSGSVTSVGLSLPSEFTVTNSPVTTAGTLTGAWASQTANYVFAAPNGAPGTPSFRALVAADVPTLNQNTTGSAASLSISGQTGLLSFTGLTSTNRIKTVRDAADTILEQGGSYTPTGTWNWTSATATWPTFNQNTTGTAAKATNLAGGIASQIPYQTAADTTTFLANGTAGQVLKSGGTGAPSWANVDGGTF